ncbi:MAG: hypothetical protein QG612_690 [Pseudomonadota bacterium]|jgi:hypothetical protein|nr:hypothetical protein [Pseudomonadota bacterium]
MSNHVWILAIAAIAGLVGLLALSLRRTGKTASTPAALPTEWPLTQRAIFSPEERVLYRQLRTALPHHMILAKLPLVRFCQPQDREELRYWFQLLGPIHVSFVVCADNGRVLAAIDIERPNRPAPKRATEIKQSVLEACRVRYVRCRADQLPTAAELQLLVPASADGQRPAVPGAPGDATPRRSTLAHAVRNTPANEASSNQWYESGFSHDSFFAPETRRDPFDDTPQSPTSRGWASGRSSRFTPGDFGPPGDAAGDIVGKR